MLVKKVDPEWYPSENPALQVGETIEITDPEVLIREGKVVPADVTATPKSSKKIKE